MKRFTAYRLNMSQRSTHSPVHRNPDHEPQFEGVVWTDGSCTLRWLTPIASTSNWASLEDALRVHGHPEYGTHLVWHDTSSVPDIWLDMLSEARRKEPQTK
jgi:hypothetical protein